MVVYVRCPWHYQSGAVQNLCLPTYVCVNICTQLTKAYVAKTSCNQLFLIESATCMLKIDLPVINKVAMSLHDVIVQRPSTVEAVNCHQSKTACH